MDEGMVIEQHSKLWSNLDFGVWKVIHRQISLLLDEDELSELNIL